MTAREVIAEGCCRPDWNKLDTADHIISLLHKAGYVILSPDEAEQVAELKAELDLLQDVIDSRPAINAALPDSYIRWSQAIYSGDAIRSLKRSDK